MAFIAGLLGLGTGISGVLQEPVAVDYARQPIFFESSPGGVTISSTSVAFGPLQSNWNTLTVFGVFDLLGNSAWMGTLNTPIVSAIGSYISVPAGSIQLDLNVTLSAFASLSGYQVAIPSAATYPANSVLTPPTTTGGLPNSAPISALLPVASSSTLGGVKVPVDGALIIDGAGNITLPISGLSSLYDQWLAGLPTSPGALGTYWNNGGIPQKVIS